MPKLSFTHFSLALPIRIEDYFVLIPGAGYHLHLDGARAEKLDWETEQGELHISDSLEGGFATLTPALAAQFFDKYSVGFSFSFGGLLPMRFRYHETYIYDSQPYDPAEGHELQWTINEYYKTSSDGSFVQVGVFAEPVPQIAVAFSYRSALDWKWHEGTDTLNVSIFEWDSATAGGQFVQVFDETSAYKLPGIFTFGLRSKPLPFITVAAEMETRPFEMTEEGDQYLGIDNGFALRFGAEVATPVMIRAGFYSEAVPRTDTGTTVPNRLNGITAGLGIPIASLFEINAGFEYAKWARKITSVGDLYSETLFRISASLKLLFPDAT